MKKNWISLFLAGCLFFACLPLTAFAAQEPAPVVIVPGMGSSALYENPGTPQEKQVFLPDMSALSSKVLDLLPYLTGANPDTDAFMDLVLPLAHTYLDPIACNPDGTSQRNVGINNYWTDSLAHHPGYYESAQTTEPALAREIVRRIGAENVYLYNYDWRKSPLEDASQLNEFLTHVKEETGSAKVTLVGASMGTAVISAYLDAYGADGLQNCVLLSPAFLGTALAGELLTGKITLVKDSVFGYMDSMDLGQWSSLIKTLLQDSVFASLNHIVQEQKDRLYQELLRPVFGNNPGIWSIVAPEYFDAAVKYIQPSEELLPALKAYHAVQGRLADNLTAAKQAGVLVRVVAQYGFYGVPITAKAAIQSDNLVETVYASGGARCADHGTVLSGKAGQPVCTDSSHQHLSADQIIDASSCILPENTWFIKGVGHVSYRTGTQVMTFVGDLITLESPLHVFSEKGYPQFMQADAQGGLAPVAENKKEEQPAPPVPANPVPPAKPVETLTPPAEPIVATGESGLSLAVFSLLAAGGALLLTRKKQPRIL